MQFGIISTLEFLERLEFVVLEKFKIALKIMLFTYRNRPREYSS